jgi:IrrE N-terminal-like domain
VTRSRAPRADKELVRAVALELLGKHGIDQAPVDPFAIAASLGILVRASNDLEGSFSGCLLRAGESFGILYSTGVRNEGYQRFTVAHELGHYSLTGHHPFLFAEGSHHRSESGFVSTVWYEREADLFGVELLIPEFLFHRHRREFPTGLDGVKGLSALFRTSLTSMAIRYATLSTEPVAVVMSEKERILYAVVSKPLAKRLELGSLWEFRDRPLPAESITRRFNERGGGGGSSEECGTVRAEQWFPGVIGAFELEEEAVRLGRYGKTLTVLTEV